MVGGGSIVVRTKRLYYYMQRFSLNRVKQRQLITGDVTPLKNTKNFRTLALKVGSKGRKLWPLCAISFIHSLNYL